MPRLQIAIVALALVAMGDGARGAGTISLTAFGTRYAQDFNTLAAAGTATEVPVGWAFAETGTSGDSNYTAGAGAVNAGDTYSFGADGSSERALGGLQIGSVVPVFGASFSNDTGGTITSLEIAYTGEQWRLGATGRPDRLVFQFSPNATSLTTGTWIDVPALNFIAPRTTGTVGAVNAAAAIRHTISGVTIPSGGGFWIRWTDFNALGADDGLAVDDFSLVAQGSGADRGHH